MIAEPGAMRTRRSAAPRRLYRSIRGERAALVQAAILGKYSAGTEEFWHIRSSIYATAKGEGLASQMRKRELALAAAQAKIDVQQRFATDFRAYLDARSGPSEDNISKLNLTAIR